MPDPFEKEKSQVSNKAFSNIRSLRSEEIFGGQREVSIIHGECTYRLQITKAGKLILTK